jgi:hypothetical protein
MEPELQRGLSLNRSVQLVPVRVRKYTTTRENGGETTRTVTPAFGVYRAVRYQSVTNLSRGRSRGIARPLRCETSPEPSPSSTFRPGGGTQTGFGGIRSGGQWMSCPSALEPQLGDGGEERVGDRNNRRRRDGCLDARAAWLGPAGDERSVPELGHGLGSKQELVSGQTGHERLELRTGPPAERGTEHARVNQQSHEVSAATNSSCSSSERSSITRSSSDARTGAAASSASVRSRGSSPVPCGPS